MTVQPKDVRGADRALDDTDRTLLRLLQTDARMPNSELAARAGIAPSTCHGRVRRLTDLGVIRG
ncbi:AsnC family transcriptional regulator, partial [Streptomyces sp. SID10244]|nr:AsnC family transcriptional regulator [Streptomyces sp. SID10244]